MGFGMVPCSQFGIVVGTHSVLWFGCGRIDLERVVALHSEEAEEGERRVERKQVLSGFRSV